MRRSTDGSSTRTYDDGGHDTWSDGHMRGGVVWCTGRMPGPPPPRFGRVAVVGDVGGQRNALFRALVALGADPAGPTLPPDLTVVQVGDLVHRGPDSSGVISLVDRVMTEQPQQWVQLAGNHEALYLGLPQFHWPQRLPATDQELLHRWWATKRLWIAAAIEVDGADAQYLVSHAGLTEGFWRHFLGMPGSAAGAAAGLNRLIGNVHEKWLFRTGVMVTESIDPAAGPMWASAPDELIPSWRQAALQMPFHQIYGHSGLLDRATGRHLGLPDRVGPFTDDPVLRHTTSTIGDRRVVGIDPGHGRRPAPAWGPLVLHRARVLIPVRSPAGTSRSAATSPHRSRST